MLGEVPTQPVATVGDSNIHVQVNGTTFAGTYEVVGLRVELTSADFGDQSAAIGDSDPQTVAERMLRATAEEVMRTSGNLYMRDDGTVELLIPRRNH